MSHAIETGEVHPVDLFHSLENLKNHFASVTFCRNSGVYNVQNGAVIVVLCRLVKGVSSMLPIAVLQMRCEVPGVCLSCCLLAVVNTV